MTHKFKKGDTVRLVRGGILGDENEDWIALAGLVVGQIYTISDISPNDEWVAIAGTDYCFHGSHFERVTKEPLKKTVRIVLEDDGTWTTLPRATPGAWLNSLSSAERKEVAIARGLFSYFPDALAIVARHSVRANEKHNPGQPVHWSREKSSDHEDCIARHSLSVAVDPDSMDGDTYHIVCRAWRALAALQVWVEAKQAKGGSI